MHRYSKKVTNFPQTCTTEGFGKPWCFPMTTYISSTNKTHPEEWMHLMCKLLAITFSKLWEKQCPHLVTLVIQVAGQQVHQSGSVGLSSSALDALQFRLLSKAQGLGFSPVPTAGGLGSASAQWDAGAAHTALAGSKFPGTGGMRLTAAERVLLVKWSWKVPWKKPI